MDDDDEEFEIDEELPLPCVKFSWQMVLIAALDATQCVLNSVAGFFEDLTEIAAAQYNWMRDRQQMHDDATLEIETLTKE